jgi:type VI protein secretion system component VasF
MTHDELERMLSRYVPREPKPGLDSRVLAAAARRYTVRLGVLDWSLMASAAVLILAAYLGSQSRDARISEEDRRRNAQVEELANVIGGDAVARRLAEMFVPKEYVDLRAAILEEQ